MSQQGVDTAAVATNLVSRMQLRSGERVLLVAVAGESDALIPALRRRIVAAGGTDLGVLAATGVPAASWQTNFTRAAPAERSALTSYLATVDLAVMMPGASPSQPAYAAMQDVLRSGKGRTIHFHWEGAYALDGSVLEVTPERSAFYQRVLRETDYSALAAIQSQFEAAVRGKTIRITTPAGTDISFMVGDRPVTKQDGDASAARAGRARNLIDREVEVPAGAIRVAPIEESVNGQIAFPPSVWGGQTGERVTGLVMRFASGRVTSFTATVGEAAVERELAQAGDAARAFRELALGFNPLLAIPTTGERWIPYYGYGAGVVRLSLGDNTELGGKVSGDYVRWNFFTDATVLVGSEVWVKDGKLVRTR